MNVCFLLHFYQPANQLSEVVKKVAQESYIPLIKSLKNNKRVRITANFSLSFLEQLDCCGYGFLIKDIKELVDLGRIELVGSAAYHPLLTKIPAEFISKQIVLNEAALGYYLGSNKDFEGEDCYMVKNVRGFFPPEMAVNNHVLEELMNLGYDWVALDEFCLPKGIRDAHESGTCYRIGGKSPKLIIRNRGLTNKISFKRDLDVSHIWDEVGTGDGNTVIALDAETFGHHFKDGVYLFELLISDIYERGLETATISQAYGDTGCKNLVQIDESTWSSVDNSVYPLWENPLNQINTALWNLYGEVHAEFARKRPQELELSLGVGAMPAWKSISDPGLDLLKLEQSDQFWWSTGVEIMGKVNFNKYMVSSALDYYRRVIKSLGESRDLLDRLQNIEKLLDESLL